MNEIRKQTFILIFLLFNLPLICMAQIKLKPAVAYLQDVDKITTEGIGDFLLHPQCIYEDSYGYIWIGTDKGVCKYDGYEIKIWEADFTDSTSLYSNLIWTIAEDTLNRLWIINEDGLSLYNRIKDEFVNFAINNIPELKVWGFYMDSRGLFYVTTNSNELFSFDPISFDWNFITATVGFSGKLKFIKAYNKEKFYEDQKGRVWLADGSDGMKCIDINNDTVTSFEPDDQAGNDKVSSKGCIGSDSMGYIWSSGFMGAEKLVDAEKKEFKYYKHIPGDAKSLFGDYCVGMALTRDGSLWISGLGGFSRYNYDTDDFKSFIVDVKDQDISLTVPKEDNEGNLWFSGYRGNGVFCFNPQNNKLLCIKSSLYENLYASDIFFDSSGAVWLSIEGEGVYKLNKNWNNIIPIEFQTEAGASIKIRTILLDNNNSLWVGTQSNGIYHSKDTYEPEQRVSMEFFKNYRRHLHGSQALISDSINKIYQDSNGNIWVTTEKGLTHIIDDKPKKRFFNFRPYSDEFNFRSPYVYDILEDDSGRLWIGTGYYLHIIDPSKNESNKVYKHTTAPRGIPINRIKILYEDKIGDIWASGSHTGLGFYKYVPEYDTFKIFNHFSNDTSIHSSCKVLDIFEDSKGRFWVSTDQGLYEYNRVNNRFAKFNLLINNKRPQVKSIVDDENGILWLPNNFGIAKFDPDTRVLQNLDQKDGLLNSYYLERSIFRDKRGYIYAGGERGIDVFHPDSIIINDRPPRVNICDLQINDESVFNSSSFLLDTTLEDTRSISLPYRNRFLRFTFTALDFNNPSKNRYKYFMSGIDNDTVYSGKRRFAEYRDIKPGKYMFWVTGSNSAGVWNDEGKSLLITIQPPWYLTKFAYLLYALLLISLILIIIRWRTIQLRKARDVLEHEVEQRTMVISDQNKEIIKSMKILEENKIELQQQKEELQSTLEDLQETQYQLIESEKMAALGGLVAGVAHEINTPVSIGLTSASSMIDETKVMAEKYKENKISRSEFKEYLNTTNQFSKLILTNMQRTAEMVQSFKQISVDQSSEQERKFNLKTYTEDIIRSLYPRLKKHKINISVKMSDDIEINSYPGVYAQIMTNLILNSLIHGIVEDNILKINISSIHQNGELTINYSDNGKGIDTGNLNRIFEPFFTTNKKSGTGLGLNIVYNLIRQKLKGNITCDSQPKKGVLFKIRFPVHDE